MGRGSCTAEEPGRPVGDGVRAGEVAAVARAGAGQSRGDARHGSSSSPGSGRAARAIGFLGRSPVFRYHLSHGLYRWSTKSQCKVNLAASACGKKPVTNVSCFPHVLTGALVTHPQTCTASHLLLSLFAGKATEGGRGGTVGLDQRGAGPAVTTPSRKSSSVHRQLQELQSVVAAVTPMILDLS